MSKFRELLTRFCLPPPNPSPPLPPPPPPLPSLPPPPTSPPLRLAASCTPGTNSVGEEQRTGGEAATAARVC